MPSLGLPDAEQKFIADGTQYHQTILELIEVNKTLITSIRELNTSIRDLNEGFKTIKDGASAFREVKMSVDEARAALGDYSQQARDLTAETRNLNASLGEAHAKVTGVTAAIEDQAYAANALRDKYANMGAAARLVTAEQDEMARQMLELSKGTDGMVRAGSDFISVADAMASKMGLMGKSIREYQQAKQDFASHIVKEFDLKNEINETGDAFERMSLKAQESMTRVTAHVQKANAAMIDNQLQLMSAQMGVGAPGMLWRSFGDGGAGAAAVGAAAGAAAGGGGRGRWTAGAYQAAAGGPDFPAGTAGAGGAAIIGFVRRWWAPFHYALMGANEMLATLLPAAAAAGAATLVGWQGVEQMIPRLKAINATAESLGGAYGITAGQYLGTGSSIQHFQNLAAGGVYQLGGAGINLMRAGQGMVGQVGLNTIAMIDRGVANMQINMAQRGTMGTLGGILGQGTGYLRSFGDIGANLGNIFLGLAPHLPGVGADYLAALQGLTGGLAGGIGFLNQHGLGDVLGGALAFEAGTRVGAPLLGVAGRGISALGSGIFRGAGALGERFAGGGGKLAGLLARGAGGIGDLGLGVTGLGDALGLLTGPEVGMAALMAYGMGQLVTYKDSAQKHVGMLQSQIGQSGFSAAFQPLAHAITTIGGLGGAVQLIPGDAGTPVVDGRHLPAGRLAAGIHAASALSDKNVFNTALSQFQDTMGNLINAGPQLVSALQKAGLKGVSMADAFQIAQNALLDTSHAFGPDGKLNKTALTMLTNTVTALGPMTRSAGGFNAAIAAQQIMGSPAMKNLSTVNQAMDQMTGIMTGGPAGMAALFGMLGGAPVTHTRAGLRVAAGPAPAFSAMAQALGSFTTAAGAGAWNTFAGQQGLISTEQQNLDQLRTFMTLGALPLGGKTGAQGIAAFQLMQMLPMASKSPAALAMLMQQGAQMGVSGYYDPSKSLKENFAAAEKSMAAMAGSAKQVDQGMNHAVIATSNLPKTAAEFTQGIAADVQSQLIAQASSDVVRLRSQAGKGLVAKGALKDLQGVLSTAGVSPEQMKGTIDASLKQAGISEKMTVKINAQLDASQAKAAIANLTHVTSQPHVTVKAEVAAAQAAINALKGKDIPVAVKQQGAAAVQAAIDSIHGKNVTVTITTINRIITQAVGAGLINTTGGFSLAGTGGMRIMPGGHQTGGLVPGSGFGDIVPAMLEPGEAIIPRYLVPLFAPMLAQHKVPGFGGVPRSSASHFATGGVAGSPPDPIIHPGVPVHGVSAERMRLIQQLIDQLNKDLKNSPLLKDFSVKVIDGIAAGLKNIGPATQKLAAGLVNKLAEEVKYAKGVAQAAAYGQGYDPTGRGSGIFGSMQLSSPSGLTQAQMHASPTGNIKDYNAYVAAYAADTVGGANQPKSVQDQMKDYLGTLKSFGTDIGKLRKQHLNKDVMAQIIAAGPTQGDQIAQSILGGQGGAKAVNQLWSQINKASKKLGAQAAEAQFGGQLSPNLKSGTIINNNVSIQVSAGGSESLANLSEKDLKALIQKIQQALLKQAKRNNKTGVKLPGKSA